MPGRATQKVGDCVLSELSVRLGADSISLVHGESQRGPLGPLMLEDPSFKDTVPKNQKINCRQCIE
jgi:hypothetical protein